MRYKYVISDLDSTIADIDHRLPLICKGFPENKAVSPDADWDTFFQRCPDDKPIRPVIRTLRGLRGAYDIVIVTGRSDEVRAKTEAWLRSHFVPYDLLLMRPAGSREADHRLKKRLIEEASIRPEEVLLALEDRQRVVDMWRSLGIRTFQVAEGDF